MRQKVGSLPAWERARLIRPPSAAGARSSEMAGKFPGKVYQGERVGRFGNEHRDGGDSTRLELSSSCLGFRRPVSTSERGTVSPALFPPRFVPPPPTARGSAPSAGNSAPERDQDTRKKRGGLVL